MMFGLSRCFSLECKNLNLFMSGKKNFNLAFFLQPTNAAAFIIKLEEQICHLCVDKSL